MSEPKQGLMSRYSNARLAVTFLMLLLSTPAPAVGQTLSATQDQHLTVIFGSWIPDASQLHVQDFALKNVLTDEDLNLLRQTLDGGSVVIQGSTASNRAGLAQRARMIVVFTSPLARQVRLKQPDASNLLYVQEGDTFRLYPSNVPLLDRFVEFLPDQNTGRVSYWVEHASIGRTGGTVSSLWQAGQGGGSANTRIEPFRIGGPIVAPQKIKDVAPVLPGGSPPSGDSRCRDSGDRR